MAIGLAVTTVIAVSHGADQIGDPQALTDGFSAGFIAAAVIAAAGGVLALLSLRTPSPPPEPPSDPDADIERKELDHALR